VYATTVIITSFVIAVGSVLVFYLSNFIEVYDHLKTKSNLFGILCFLEHFYSYIIFLCSVITFTVIFDIHASSIKEFSNYVNEMQYDFNAVNKMFLKYLQLKASYDESVKRLNSLFSITTFCGFFALYGLINGLELPKNIFELFYIILYVMAECIYFYTINKVAKSITLIQHTIFSGSFTQKYLRRQPFQEENKQSPVFEPESRNLKDTGKVFSTNSITTLSNYIPSESINDGQAILIDNKKIHRTYKIIKDGQTSFDWLILTKLMSIPWKDIELFGFDVDGYNLLKKSSIVLIAMLLNKYS
jgi:hypothetical protein